MKGRAALVALAGMLLVGCGGETKDSTEPVTFLKGHVTIVPLRSAFIAIHDSTPQQERAIQYLLSAKKVAEGSYYLPPKQLRADCEAGVCAALCLSVGAGASKK